MQLEGGAAVLLVVALDLLEQRVVTRLDPLLEADDGLVAAGDVRGADEAVELLDLLDRVALGRGADRLPDDAVEVDEHLLAQEVVDLGLAGAVLAHEAGQRRALVGGVVVDVHARVAPAALDDPVDELLERGALGVAIPPPDRGVLHGAVVVAIAVAEEVLEPARGLVERVALHVEPDVAGVRLGQETEAALLLVGEELVQVAALAAAAELERGLEADALVRLGVGARRQEPVAGDAGRSPSCASVPTPPSMSVSACARRIPATRLRWSSSTRRSRHLSLKSQIPQWETGQPYVSGSSSVSAARKRLRTRR